MPTNSGIACLAVQQPDAPSAVTRKLQRSRTENACFDVDDVHAPIAPQRLSEQLAEKARRPIAGGWRLAIGRPVPAGDAGELAAPIAGEGVKQQSRQLVPKIRPFVRIRDASGRVMS